jgi:hypothetical protein
MTRTLYVVPRSPSFLEGPLQEARHPGFPRSPVSEKTLALGGSVNRGNTTPIFPYMRYRALRYPCQTLLFPLYCYYRDKHWLRVSRGVISAFDIPGHLRRAEGASGATGYLKGSRFCFGKRNPRRERGDDERVASEQASGAWGRTLVFS